MIGKEYLVTPNATGEISAPNVIAIKSRDSEGDARIRTYLDILKRIQKKELDSVGEPWVFSGRNQSCSLSLRLGESGVEFIRFSNWGRYQPSLPGTDPDPSFSLVAAFPRGYYSMEGPPGRLTVVGGETWYSMTDYQIDLEYFDPAEVQEILDAMEQASKVFIELQGSGSFANKIIHGSAFSDFRSCLVDAGRR